MKINKLSRNLAIASLLTPVGVNALGIGEIQLNSALNQNFSAEIPLIASPGENTKNIRVKLASPAAFEKAGVERSYLLSTLRFKPELNADGTMSVKVLSNDAIREPFLNFLVEVNWAEGRMLKEYIVLLDPPGSVDQAVVTAQTAPQWQQDQTRRQNNQPGEEVIVTEEERLFGEQVDPEYSSDTQVTGLTQDNNKPEKKLGTGFSRSVVVPKGAILWNIAEKMRADTGGSQEQMLLALFRNNPDAFYQNNINALNAGALLKVPSLVMLQSISREEGIEQVSEHNQRWNKQFVARTSPQEATKQTTKAASAGQLKLAPAGSDDASAENDALLERLQTLLSQLELVTEENSLLKDQIADLDSKIKVLSEQTATVVPQGKVKPVVLPPKTQDAADVNAKVSTTKAADKAVNEALLPKDIATESEKNSSVVKPPVVGDIKAKPILEKVKKSATDIAKKPVATVKPANESDSLMDSPWVIGSMIGALSLGLIGWQVNRRRKSVVQEESELSGISSAFAEKQLGEVNPAKVDALGLEQTAKQDSELGDSIFFSEYRATESISNINAMEVDHNDLDPLSEADVYVAYGRYQQAEELIQQALDDHPDRDEYKLKLLEIHHAKDDTVGFTEYITQLREEGKTTSADFWIRAKEIGNGFAPANLFGEELAVKEFEEVDEFSSELFGIDSESESLELNDDLSAIFADNSIEAVEDDGVAVQSVNSGNEEANVNHVDSTFAVDRLSTEEMDVSLDDSDSFSLNLTELDKAVETEQIDSENSIDFMLSEAEESGDKTISEMNIDSEVDSISWDLDMDSEDAQLTSDFPVDTIGSNSVLLETDESELQLTGLDSGASIDLEMDTTDSLGLFSSVEMTEDSFSMDLDSQKASSNLEGMDELDLNQAQNNQETDDFQLVIDGKSDDVQFIAENDASTILSMDDASSELVESPQISDLLDEVTEHNTEFVDEKVVSELFEPTTLVQESELFESELSDLDEVADKLDLARVYIDMEDGESARGILNEVIELGTDEQKEIAKSMVQTIEKSA